MSIFYIKPSQVFQCQIAAQTFLYRYELRNLARNCAKIHYLHSTEEVLCSKLANGSILHWFDGKNIHFSVKSWSYFWRLFHTVRTKELISRNFFVISFYSTFPHSTVWKSGQKYDHDFYGKMNIFSVKSMQIWIICQFTT